ncbi:MAG: hypothetical protein KF796_09400 [Ramlibacter sp.]|nr:hypothetical protein [Ramlibacter sp.]
MRSSHITRLVVGFAMLLATLCAEAASLRQMQLGSYNFSYYSNKTLQATMPAITRVVIVQHGINRDGDPAFTAANDALHNSGANIPEILLIAPQFWNDADSSAGKVPAGAPYWFDEQWSLGYDSMDSRHLSSFTVIDDLIRKFADATAYPNVTQIVVAGHSAGAQMYSRYAAFNTVHGGVRSGVLVKYVLANAGTHLYFSTDRPVGNAASGATAFGTFTGAAACPGYDTYKYGNTNYSADGPFNYPHTLTPQARFIRFAGRKAYYYQGTADTVPYTASNGPDDNCAAVLSGSTRLARGVTNARYQRYLAGQLGVSLDRLFRRVEGVGHSASGMWNASCVMTALYGTAQMLNTTGASCSDLN